MQGTWTLPWMRPPSWLYLPHLPGGVDRPEAQELGDEGRSSARGSDVGGGGSPTSCRGGLTDREDALGEAASAGTELGSGSRPNQGTGGVALHEIRGRALSPGRVGGGPLDDAIRGPQLGPGARAADAQARAQLRLDARNAHLRRSLDDHEERVLKRKSQEAAASPGPSAAERLAALRRRIRERASASDTATLGGTQVARASGDGGGGAGNQCGQNTIEVSKIHLYDGFEAAGNAAGITDVAGHSACDVRGSPSGADAGIDNIELPPAQATAAAARVVAWHSVVGQTSAG